MSSIVVFVVAGMVAGIAAGLFVGVSISAGVSLVLAVFTSIPVPTPVPDFEWDMLEEEEAVEWLPKGAFESMVLGLELALDAVDAEWEVTGEPQALTEAEMRAEMCLINIEEMEAIGQPIPDSNPIIECPEATTPEEDLLAEWEADKLTRWVDDDTYYEDLHTEFALDYYNDDYDR